MLLTQNICPRSEASSANMLVLRTSNFFVYTVCLINICLSLSDDANKIKTLNIERT